MKRRFHALIFACVIVSPLAHAGIPVLVDADPLRELEWLKEAQRWMQTAQHYQSQIQAYKNQLATATGVRDIADFVDQAKSLKSDLEKLRKPARHSMTCYFPAAPQGSSMRCIRSTGFSIPAMPNSQDAMLIPANSWSSIRRSSLSRLTRSVNRSARHWARLTASRTVSHYPKTQRSLRTLPTVFS